MRRALRAASLIAFLAAAVFLCAQVSRAADPELPRSYMDTTYVAPTGNTIMVGAGGNFQAALNAAQPGDVIKLAAGATYTGTFTLPKKTGDGWITITTDADMSLLPAEGSRVHPSYSSVMPKLRANSATVLRTAAGAHHYRFMGVEVSPTFGTATWNLIEIGDGGTGERPHDIIFDRSYIHGDPYLGTTRGLSMNGTNMAVIDSYVSDFKKVGYDTQAILGYNGDGPYKIVNNYLEAAGENVMFGGADPAVVDRIPSDIEIRNNTFHKPLAWKIGHPRYEGTAWTIKNLFELKIAKRVLVEGNTFEQSWPHAQSGYAILFTVRNQSNTAPWSTIQDVTFTKNLVQHSGQGVLILGEDSKPCIPMERVSINNNVFDDIGWNWGTRGKWLVLISNSTDLVVDHNTSLQDDNIISAGGTPHSGFVLTNNITPHNLYGVHGSGKGVGQSSLDYYFPGAVVGGNAVIGGSDFPAVDYSPATIDDVGFVDYANGNYELLPTSPYVNAGTDGLDVGVDWDALQAALALPQSEMYIVRTFAAGSHTMELRGEDFGRDDEGYVENMVLDEVLLAGSASLLLEDAEDNGQRGGAAGSSEALYVGMLSMGSGSVLDLNGLNVYVLGAGQLDGTVINGDLISMIMGDATQDFLVDGADLAVWQRNYDPLGVNALTNTFEMGDWNGDGKIDGNDLSLWQINYDPLGASFAGIGSLDPGSSAVPEPGSMVLLATAFAGLAAFTRRRK